jgi:hypothetical protein
LKPSAWGYGREVADKLIYDFKEAKLDASLFIYLPPTRNTSVIARKLNLVDSGQVNIANKVFQKLLVKIK